LTASLPEFEHRVILEEVLEVAPGRLPRNIVLNPFQQRLVDIAVAQRLAGVPLQYVIGRWEFCGLSIALERGVLIPRPETEGLVEEVLARVPADARGIAVDLGTGTGAIALAVAHARPGMEVRAWDVNPRAARLARRNARLTRIPIHVEEADLRSAPLPARGVALIASNPPYIAHAEIAQLDTSVRDHESHLALDGGPDGLDLVRAVLARAAEALAPGGLAALEIGWDQGPRALEAARAAGATHVEVRPDLAGKDRVLLARWAR